jgi:hypothetical protein
MIRRFAWTLGIAILVLTVLVPVPARAEQEITPAELAGTTSDAQPGCGAEVLDLAAEAPICPAVQIGVPEPEFMARRGYCRCGCGVTCTSDADCGPGGSCVRFITCC